MNRENIELLLKGVQLKEISIGSATEALLHAIESIKRVDSAPGARAFRLLENIKDMERVQEYAEAIDYNYDSRVRETARLLVTHAKQELYIELNTKLEAIRVAVTEQGSDSGS